MPDLLQMSFVCLNCKEVLCRSVRNGGASQVICDKCKTEYTIKLILIEESGNDTEPTDPTIRDKDSRGETD